MKINFITTNKGKVISLQKAFEEIGHNDVKIFQQELDIIEPQADTVKEVSKNKAIQAHNILKQPVLVEDGGFYINALKGFPGVYTKYILDTIGAEGLLRLMKNETNRACKFVSCLTYIDLEGNITQFDSSNNAVEGELAKEMIKIDCKEAWSDIWHIYKNKSTGKTLAEESLEIKNNCYSNCNKDRYKKHSIELFVNWYINSL